MYDLKANVFPFTITVCPDHQGLALLYLALQSPLKKQQEIMWKVGKLISSDKLSISRSLSYYYFGKKTQHYMRNYNKEHFLWVHHKQSVTELN